MDYKEKYEQALERCKKEFNFNNLAYSHEEIKQRLEHVFPELKEDERIRKALIQYIKYKVSVISGWRKEELIAWFEKQGEQKPADQVKPKFKVGDWVIYCDEDIDLITGIEEKGYRINEGGYIPFISQENMRMWTIQDARDGDVLAFDSEYKGNRMVQVGIIKKYVGKHGGCSNTFNIYVGVNGDNNLQIDEYMGCSDRRPATKEQRDLLFVKLKEAGYEWDADKKELRKIEQISTDLPNGEDYGIDGLYAAVDILQKTLGNVNGYQTDDGILEHECAISAVKKLYEQKPAWSEENSCYYDDICEILINLINSPKSNVNKDVVQKDLDWLISLRSQQKQE